MKNNTEEKINTAGETSVAESETAAADKPGDGLPYAEILENMPYGAALFDLTGRDLDEIYCNRRYCEMMGRDQSEKKRLSFLDMVYPGDRELVSRELVTATRQGRSFTADVRILSVRGRYRQFHVVANIVSQGVGKKQVYAAFLPRGGVEMAFQDMQRGAMDAMLGSTDDFIFVKDVDMRYVFVSRSMVVFLGVENELEIVGRTDEELFDEKYAGSTALTDRRTLEQGESLLDFEETITAPDGRVRYSSVSKYPLRDSQDNIIGVYGISRDVSALHDATFELDALLNAIPSGVLKYAADDSEEIAYISRSFIERLGYTETQFREKFHNRFSEMICKEDRKRHAAETLRHTAPGVIGKFDYRIETAAGALRWFHGEGTRIADKNGKNWYYATLVDVTESKRVEEQLRTSEEEARLAIRQSNTTICRYDVASHTLFMPEKAVEQYGFARVMENVPVSQVLSGKVSPDTAGDYETFFGDIQSGVREGGATYQRNLNGQWRWIEAHFTTIFSDEDIPKSAVISFEDVTDRIEKDAIYSKWEQSLNDRPEGSYSLYRCNLNRSEASIYVEGSLVQPELPDGLETLNDRMRAYARKYVLEEDRAKYLAFTNSDGMLARYFRGRRSESMEFREKQPDGDQRWLKLSVELVQLPNSSDVMAYMMYENIDEVKREELQTKERAETDPLTGVLNRSTFVDELAQRLERADTEGLDALIIFDLDGFKQVNDRFGHDEGDKTLVEVAHKVRKDLRSGDLFCRLGGDEFMLCLCSMPDLETIEKKAARLGRLMRKPLDEETIISASMGIAVIPNDGTEFESLYHKADRALYCVKASGKDSFAFYREDMEE